jgi:hypothetical protein
MCCFNASHLTTPQQPAHHIRWPGLDACRGDQATGREQGGGTHQLAVKGRGRTMGHGPPPPRRARNASALPRPWHVGVRVVAPGRAHCVLTWVELELAPGCWWPPRVGEGEAAAGAGAGTATGVGDAAAAAAAAAAGTDRVNSLEGNSDGHELGAASGLAMRDGASQGPAGGELPPCSPSSRCVVKGLPAAGQGPQAGGRPAEHASSWLLRHLQRLCGEAEGGGWGWELQAHYLPAPPQV